MWHVRSSSTVEDGESVKIQLKLWFACHANSLIAEFQLIFKLTLDELQVLFTSCVDVKKERNSDGGMTLSKEKLQRTHSIRTTEKAAIHRLSYNRQRRITKA